MGANISNVTSSITSANDVITSSISNATDTCTSNDNSTQSIQINAIAAPSCSSNSTININGLSNVIQKTLTFSCAQQASNSLTSNTDLQQDITSAISETTSEMQFLNGNQQTNDLTNLISNNITTSSVVNNMASCIANITNDQSILENVNNYCNVNISDLSNALSETILQTCIQKNDTLNNVANTAATALSQGVSTSNTGIDPASFLSSIIVPIVLGAILLFGLAIYGHIRAPAGAIAKLNPTMFTPEVNIGNPPVVPAKSTFGRRRFGNNGGLSIRMKALIGILAILGIVGIIIGAVFWKSTIIINKYYNKCKC